MERRQRSARADLALAALGDRGVAARTAADHDRDHDRDHDGAPVGA
jgi:hypothetical protein